MGGCRSFPRLPIHNSMTFKTWLESTEEQYSNEMTERLCSWIKLHGRKPKAGPAPILAGSPTAGTRVSYNLDLEENRLGEFLKEKISSGRAYPSDLAILQRHGMEGLFETGKEDRRATSLKNVKKLADYYKKNGHYPKSNDPHPEVRFLAGFLRYKREVRKGRKGKIYDGEMELGISLGLPEDWLDYDERANQARQNELNIRRLADYYKKNGHYPKETDPDPEARYLFRWLGFKRATRKTKAVGKTYDGEMELGISLGLPDDWLDHDLQSKQIEQNELNIRRLAEFYKKNGRYPKKTDADSEARFLANWLRRRRGVIRGVRSRPYYDDEKELGISLGLPDDWLDYNLQSEQEEQNELNIRRLAEFYKKNGRYPQGRDSDHETRLLANWLQSRRRARKGTRGRTYDGEKELGISLGLPEDWLDPQGNK
jgi:ribosomal protein S15P/S13E